MTRSTHSQAEKIERDTHPSEPCHRIRRSFIADRQILLLTIVDHFTRESLAIEVGQRMRGKDVVAALERLACNRTLPRSIRVDNGPEFRSKVLDQRAYANGVTLDFSRPGKPTDNAFIESFNGSARTECLNENWFLSLDDAKEKIEAWRVDYNEH